MHVSATPETAALVLEMSSEYCHDAAIPFKHLAGSAQLITVLAKDAERSSAGKFVTIYPATETQLRECLVALDCQLGGLPGPYILSDLRWNAGPVHVRYGAFTFQQVLHEGVRTPAVRDLHRNVLVPDVRGTSFTVPPWVAVPPFLRDQMDRLQPTPPRWFPSVTRALQHSNAGGVYEAMVNGVVAILKEARPHTGFTPDGRDAVTRLRNEEETLRALQATRAAPAVLTSFELHGHRFLATEIAAGRSLSAAVASTNPLGESAAGIAAMHAYRDWALRVGANLRAAVDTIHAAGRTHGDLHPGNVLVDEVGNVTLIDFEMSQDVDDAQAVPFGVPGFVAPGTISPPLRDVYAVACIELHMFVPLTPLVQLDEEKVRELASFAAAAFGLSTLWENEMTVRLAHGFRPPTARRRSPTPTRDVPSVINGLLSDADATRTDRLWPGDPHQFAEPKFAIAHGALGVALALHQTGVAVTGDARDWITAAVNNRQHNSPLGFMDGISGALLASRLLGWTQLADDLLDEVIRRRSETLSTDLYAGAPGVALALLSEATARPELRDLALQAVRDLNPPTASPPSQMGADTVATGRGGLMRGASGLALTALHAYSVTRDPDFLTMASAAIDRDLRTLIATSDGALHVNEGWRSLPYFGTGSAGIGLVLALYLNLSADEPAYREALEKITFAACAPFTAQVGLLHGRSGLIHYLREIDHLGFGNLRVVRALTHHTEQLWLHAIQRDGVTRFAGDGLLRASSDLSTGAAGVLPALVGACALPFLRPPVWQPVSEKQEGGETHGVPVVTSVARAR